MFRYFSLSVTVQKSNGNHERRYIENNKERERERQKSNVHGNIAKRRRKERRRSRRRNPRRKGRRKLEEDKSATCAYFIIRSLPREARKKRESARMLKNRLTL